MENITVKELHERLANGEEIHVIDVREPDEYEQDNLGAQLVPLSQLRNFDTDAIDDLRNDELIVHCRSGRRSIEACNILEEAGFVDVVNLEGGILEWRKQFGSEQI